MNCTWTIQVRVNVFFFFATCDTQTEKNLYLLVTFHNLSAPFTVDCEGAYIEVEQSAYIAINCVFRSREKTTDSRRDGVATG